MTLAMALGAMVGAPGDPPQKSQDWELWRRARDGHEHSATQLVQLLMPQALGLARQLLVRQEDAEDAVQESFVRLWCSSPANEHGSRLSTYFNTIVINRCRTRLASRKEELLDEDTMAQLQANREGDTDTPGAQTSHPMSGLSTGDTARRLLAAVHSLPPRQRMAIAMWAYTGASVKEIARALEIDQNSAHQLLHRAKQSLRGMLERENT